MFQFNNLPSFEILYIYGNEPIKYTGPPGIIALNLVNTLINGEENSITDFMNKYSYPKVDNKEQTILGQMFYLNKIYEHRSIMDGFIKTVFLFHSENEGSLEAFSNDERITHFFKNEKYEGLVKDVFQALSIKPYFKMPGNIELKGDYLEIEGNAEVKNINLFVTDKANIKSETKSDQKNLIALDYKLLFTWDYESTNMFTLAWLELLLMADSGIKIKSCHKCNAYFSPFPPNTLHCEKCREKHTAQTLYRERIKQRIDHLPENVRVELLNEEREKRAEYMREYRKKKKGLSQKQSKNK